MLSIFVGCLAFGVAFSVLSVIFGSHGGDHGGFHHAGGVDGHSGVDHADSPSPFNPLVISSAITAFGAVGIIAKTGFHLGDLLSTVFGLGFAGAIGTAIFFGIVKFMYGSQSNSVFSMDDLVDTEAEVITPIPANGVGEIAYVINGIRYNLSARSYLSEDIPRNSTVIIREISGNAALVQKKIDLDDLGLYDIQDELKGDKPRNKTEN
jgi:hypothetical protein